MQIRKARLGDAEGRRGRSRLRVGGAASEAGDRGPEEVKGLSLRARFLPQGLGFREGYGFMLHASCGAELNPRQQSPKLLSPFGLQPMRPSRATETGSAVQHEMECNVQVMSLPQNPSSK